MPTRKLSKSHKRALEALGRKIEEIILEHKRYPSLDAFSLEYHDQIAKPTLYEICCGRRDMKFSTLLSLAQALETPLHELLEDILTDIGR